jgi:hypothetical protein
LAEARLVLHDTFHPELHLLPSTIFTNNHFHEKSTIAFSSANFVVKSDIGFEAGDICNGPKQLPALRRVIRLKLIPTP